MNSIPLPSAFLERMQALLGEDFNDFLSAITKEEISTIRLHPLKNYSVPENSQPVAWEPLAYHLHERPVFALDPAWHAGAYYVQESSSMLTGAFLREIIARLPSPIILDACAAPGGKSTHLLSLMNGKGLLVANETIPKRNIILTENIQKWGYPNVVITKASTRQLGQMENYFDIIVIDAPCSGEGLFRKNPEAIGEWSPDAVEHCAIRQRDILHDVIPALKTGGYLCYSTCTFEVSENEDQVQRLLDSGLFELVPLNSKLYEGLEEGLLSGTIRCWPHKVAGSGFFIALLRKVEHRTITWRPEKMRKQNWKTLSQLPPPAQFFIKNDPLLSYWTDGSFIRLFPSSLQQDLQRLNGQFQVIYFGVEAGQLKKDIFTPAHSLLYSVFLHEQIPRIGLDRATSLDFLRRKNIQVSVGTKGWAVVEYQGNPIGWVKILSDRINNYLPSDKMLRMA